MRIPHPYFCPFSVSAALKLPPTTLSDELTCTVRDDEHLLEEFPDRLLSFLKDFLDFRGPNDEP